MDNERPMKIVLLEDDISACRKFIACANSRTDIIFVGITGRSDDGLEHVRNKLPEAVIVDLELTWGQGSGFDFLEKLYAMEFDIRPIVVITTRNRCEDLHAQLHAQYGIDWIFCKLQDGYSPEMVIRHLLRFRPYFSKRHGGMNPSLKTLESPEELKNRILQRIKAEMDAFGISVKYKGRKIIEEAIYLILSRGEKNSETVFQDLARMHKTHYNNIIRNIQKAIYDAWDNTDDIEALLRVYTAPIRKETGAPSPTEFVYYYADKIRRDM